MWAIELRIYAKLMSYAWCRRRLNHAVLLKVAFLLHTALPNGIGELNTSLVYPCLNRSISFAVGSSGFWLDWRSLFKREFKTYLIRLICKPSIWGILHSIYNTLQAPTTPCDLQSREDLRLVLIVFCQKIYILGIDEYFFRYGKYVISNQWNTDEIHMKISNCW